MGIRVTRKGRFSGATRDDALWRLQQANKFCEVDNLPIQKHARCPGCWLLYGIGHLAQIGGGGLCNYCNAKSSALPRFYSRVKPMKPS